MTCPRCQGCLVPERELGLPPSERCVNRGFRPPLARPIGKRVITRHPKRLPRPALAVPVRPPSLTGPRRRRTVPIVGVARQAALAIVRALAADGAPVSKLGYDDSCLDAGQPYRTWHLTGHAGSPSFVAWPDVLREAGLTPTPEQISKSRARLGVSFGRQG